MKRAIDTGMDNHGRPYEWAIAAGGMLFTAAVPVAQDGTVETGDIVRQTTVTLENLARTLKLAGGSMADVTQVTLYVTDRSFVDPINEVWRTAFPRPYPNRGTVIVSEIGLKGTKLMIMVQAYLGGKD